ncbi:MAG TPA: prepilin-type N-terminal cleavage/methylation domain-containing protein [Candidatus Binatia bacterium]|nr:prepilin-type N-terminal cleavage/methylation domain-containing protein [Candidatus Binatia bacterium]
MTSPAGKDSRGFSLLELVLVLVVMGISMAIVVPNIGRRLQEREVRSSALSLAAVARDLRSRALLDGIVQQLIVSIPQNAYLVPKLREIHLPQDVRIASIEGGEAVERDTKRFYFFPNGSSLGGQIVIADNANSISYYIRMEPLTGKIEVARGDNL